MAANARGPSALEGPGGSEEGMGVAPMGSVPQQQRPGQNPPKGGSGGGGGG